MNIPSPNLSGPLLGANSAAALASTPSEGIKVDVSSVKDVIRRAGMSQMAFLPWNRWPTTISVNPHIVVSLASRAEPRAFGITIIPNKQTAAADSGTPQPVSFYAGSEMQLKQALAAIATLKKLPESSKSDLQSIPQKMRLQARKDQSQRPQPRILS